MESKGKLSRSVSSIQVYLGLSLSRRKVIKNKNK